MLNLTNKGIPTCLGVSLHALIFFIVIYFYFKTKENFDVCPPGYEQTEADNSIFDFDFYLEWCKMGDKKLEDSDDDDDDSNDNDKERCLQIWIYIYQGRFIFYR